MMVSPVTPTWKVFSLELFSCWDSHLQNVSRALLSGITWKKLPRSAGRCDV